jgi:hypothetical protein
MARNRFANDFQIQYGCVIDHDTYNSLRVSIEVDRENPETRGEVFLNGHAIGTVEFLGKKRFHATRYNGEKRVTLGEFKELGRAAAGIISDFITA